MLYGRQAEWRPTETRSQNAYSTNHSWCGLFPRRAALARRPRRLARGLLFILRTALECQFDVCNTGGNADSVASIAGAITGAMYPETIDDDWFRIVEEVNQHNLLELAEGEGRLMWFFILILYLLIIHPESDNRASA